MASDLKAVSDLAVSLLWVEPACQDSAHWLAVDSYGNLFYTDAKACVCSILQFEVAFMALLAPSLRKPCEAGVISMISSEARRCENYE